ncbi:MAG TPA: hypothetical protein VFY25_05455 [Anaerolineales bacterium]|nr:hypothetical protein [Anaerolineales bacterium]
MSISYTKQSRAGTIKMESELGRGSLLTTDFPCFAWQNRAGAARRGGFLPINRRPLQYHSTDRTIS